MSSGHNDEYGTSDRTSHASRVPARRRSRSSPLWIRRRRDPVHHLGAHSPAETATYLSEVAREVAREPRTSFTLAVATLDDALIGAANLTITDAKSTGELGYVLARDQWGRGYAIEVARRLIVFGFDDLGLHRITATCHPDNFASARVLEKAGMGFEGTLRGHLRVRGGWRDSRVSAIVTGDEAAVHSD